MNAIALPKPAPFRGKSVHASLKARATVRSISDRKLSPRMLSALLWSAGADAPVRLIYVAELAKFDEAGFPEPGLQDPETQKAYYFVDTGLVAGNVYLFASSKGLAAWFHNCNRVVLAEKLALKQDQRVLFGQSVGYPLKD